MSLSLVSCFSVSILNIYTTAILACRRKKVFSPGRCSLQSLVLYLKTHHTDQESLKENCIIFLRLALLAMLHIWKKRRAHLLHIIFLVRVNIIMLVSSKTRREKNINMKEKNIKSRTRAVILVENSLLALLCCSDSAWKQE